MASFFGLEKVASAVIGVFILIGLGIFVMQTFADGLGWNEAAENSTVAANTIMDGITTISDNLLPLVGTIALIAFVMVLWHLWRGSGV